MLYTDPADVDAARWIGSWSQSYTLTNPETGVVYTNVYSYVPTGETFTDGDHRFGLKLGADVGEYFRPGDTVVLEYAETKYSTYVNKFGWAMEPYAFQLPREGQETDLDLKLYKRTKVNININISLPKTVPLSRPDRATR